MVFWQSMLWAVVMVAVGTSEREGFLFSAALTSCYSDQLPFRSLCDFQFISIFIRIGQFYRGKERQMEFPERVYTKSEVKKAKALLDKGYKHKLMIEGNQDFKDKVKDALKLVKTADYYDFLRTYIRRIVEIDGLSQLREAEAAIWANMYAIADSVEAAGFFIQKAQQMKDYLEGKLYYETGEIRAVNKRIEFMETLKEKSTDEAIKRRCEKLLKAWTETIYP
jgi:hypothetical protein